MRSVFIVAASVALASSAVTLAQRRPSGTAEEKVGVAIDLKVNGTPYTFKGDASCDHLALGSIYGVMAQRWTARQHDEAGRSVSLSLWRPANGAGDMLQLNISMGGKRYDVSTVKRPQGPSGSAAVKLVPDGKGGTFTIDAATASAARITGTVKCSAFPAAEEAAGG